MNNVNSINTANVLQIKNVIKRYGTNTAVDNISMTIRKGDVYGLIGKNGAGKTTLMRIISSLTFAQNGEIEIFGEKSEAGLTNARKRIGCVVETPAFYPNLSARQNLEYYRIFRGIPDKNAVDNALKTVKLSGAGKKKFKNFSLGMKQRLGLALALLNNPDFIILDEPINGLDPTGIAEIRETLKKLNSEHGITLLVSSHILNELSLIATRYGIINNGKMIKELTDEELRERCKKCISVIVDDITKAVTVIETVLNTNKYKVVSDKEIRIYDYFENTAEVTFQLNASGVRVSSISEIGDNLEDYFLSLIKEEKNHA